MALLELERLNKAYKKNKVIKDLSFDLNKGEIMGLIGQNGSGKTTIFKTILGLVQKNSGQMRINGHLIDGKSKHYLNKIGAMIEYPTFYENLTASQNLSLISSLYEGKKVGEEDILEILRVVGLENNVDAKVSSFSLGMKQRLGLAQALLHRPSILLLDEPFNGLDPLGMKELRQLLMELAAKGVGIIVSSHSLEELNKIVDSVTLIKQGKVLFQGSKSEFLAMGMVKNSWLLKTDQLEETQAILQSLAIPFTEKDGHLELVLDPAGMKDVKDKLLTKLLNQGISIINFSEKQENFEDVFLKIQTAMEEE
ncbi:ABC transporter ATP-binding protein [Atopobacter sp. AH10]|uniref:ABC transporter ATP-binding protein n=1 Tax=Atopobacter sp. AH10 TaxID=2315861 RepID=UPI000EF27A69|nr:ABC transporter ATP-binding protein [Atopobacter sp. AH10]RLK63799.1 ABC transporter ATP-binding protein [Atopobacter sp. AH10]